MGVVRNTIILTAAMASPTVFVAPPLKTVPTAESYAHRENMNLTPMGLAGKRLFISQCSECHGRSGRGTGKGPSLHHPMYSTARFKGRQFHMTVREGVSATVWSYGDMPAAPNLSFNEIELMARYVREVRAPNKYR